MLKLKVPDMACGHCGAAVKEAVRSVDGNARVDIDLVSKTVTIESTAEVQRITTALDAEGYPSQPA